MPRPVGLPQKEVIRTLTIIQAFGEIMNVQKPTLDGILDKARAELELMPDVPIKPPVTP